MTAYDDPDFRKAYDGMPRSTLGLAGAGEWPVVRQLLPALEGLDIMDLGCGYGWHSQYFLENGARSVTALDASPAMLEVAKGKCEGLGAVKFIEAGIEEWKPGDDSYDLVFSNLALHYVLDLGPVFKAVGCSLRKGGLFIFNIEHPVFTAGVDQSFLETDKGLIWPVDGYFAEGWRDTVFLSHHVRKAHHTLESLVTGLLSNGFLIEALKEVRPSDEDLMKWPEWAIELKRPMMLVVRARLTEA